MSRSDHMVSYGSASLRPGEGTRLCFNSVYSHYRTFGRESTSSDVSIKIGVKMLDNIKKALSLVGVRCV